MIFLFGTLEYKALAERESNLDRRKEKIGDISYKSVRRLSTKHVAETTTVSSETLSSKDAVNRRDCVCRKTAYAQAMAHRSGRATIRGVFMSSSLIRQVEECGWRLPHICARWVVSGLSLASISAFAAGALPQDGRFVAGTGVLKQDGAKLTVAQSSPYAVIDWKSFSIGAGNTVAVQNPGGATLNRVTGPTPSRIDGTLTGIAAVYLVNPQGVVIGKNGVVATGGRFVASTLDVSNSDFMRNYPYMVFSGNGEGSVINLGKISSQAGEVLLLAGRRVVNAGEIDAANGSVEMAAGRTANILVAWDDTGRQVSVQMGSAGTVENAGIVRAAQISLEAADGNIYALAGRNREMRATGTEQRDGHVWLIAEQGKVGIRDASIAAGDKDGKYGVVEIRAAQVKAEGANVDASYWSITTSALTIDEPLARTFSRNLSAGTSINIDTANLNSGSAQGNIGLRANLTWRGDAMLSLRAGRSVTIERGVKIGNAGGGSLRIFADGNGVGNGGSVVNNGLIEWCRSTGLVEMYYDRNGAYVPGVQRTNPAWRAAHLSGLKTQITGYMQINDSADFSAIYDNLAGNYHVNPAANLYSGATLSAPIGSAEHPFTGQFDGGGTVLSVNVDARNTNSNSATGMFGVIGEGAVVRNFALVNGSTTAGEGALGMIAGRNDGLVLDVFADGTVRGGTTATGGVVGINRGVMAKTRSNFTTVSGGAATGGTVGINEGIVIRAAGGGGVGAVTSEHGPAGGVAGENRGHIEQSYYGDQLEAPTVSAGGAVGGLIGSNSGSISQSVTNARTSTTLSGAPLGGVAGVNVGQIGSDVFWGKEVGNATSGVGQGTMIPTTSGLTTAGLGKSASYGPTWDFSSSGAWEAPEQYGFPQLRY
jgi:filamentous hemagglutinin family protein